MKTDATYLAELRSIIGPGAFIHANPMTGLLEAWTATGEQAYESAGEEEALLRFCREKAAECVLPLIAQPADEVEFVRQSADALMCPDCGDGAAGSCSSCAM